MESIKAYLDKYGIKYRAFAHGAGIMAYHDYNGDAPTVEALAISQAICRAAGGFGLKATPCGRYHSTLITAA